MAEFVKRDGDFAITAEGKRELWEATKVWLDAIRNLEGIVARQCPVKVGDIIKEHEYDTEDATRMVVEEISHDCHGMCVCRGRLITKSGKLGKRPILRRINLHHLDVQESPMTDPDCRTDTAPQNPSMKDE
jgi:hypothetical protein